MIKKSFIKLEESSFLQWYQASKILILMRSTLLIQVLLNSIND